MNREIKYRAYIKDDYKKELVGKILEVSSIHFKTRKAIIGYSLGKSDYGNKSFSFNDIELMQYTGLHDKNEKEIYEEDIVKYEDMTGKILFLNGSFIMSDLEETEEWELGVINDEVEVIGNIYDNPELLGGE